MPILWKASVWPSEKLTVLKGSFLKGVAAANDDGGGKANLRSVVLIRICKGLGFYRSQVFNVVQRPNSNRHWYPMEAGGKWNPTPCDLILWYVNYAVTSLGSPSVDYSWTETLVPIVYPCHLSPTHRTSIGYIVLLSVQPNPHRVPTCNPRFSSPVPEGTTAQRDRPDT